MSILDFAKFYTDRKWDVFPLPPRAKIPRVKWPEVATHEQNMAVGWWDTDPEANIAIATGKRSGIVVVDVDPDHGGYESLTELIVQHGKLPNTPVARTGGGGEHLFFAHPDYEIRNSAGRLGPGLDVRGDGGYVVAAPSVHPNGKSYEWVVKPSETPLAPMPAWMLDALKDTAPTAMPVSANGGIANGSRNNTLTSLAGSMRRRGFDEDAIFSALKIHNAKFCRPPLTDGEILVIAKSISRYSPEQHIIPAAPDAFSVIDGLEADIHERQRNPVDVWGIHYAWPFLSLVTGGKQLGELIILAGEPGVGKSWWAHQDAMVTAVDKQVPVLVWSGEMSQKQVFRRMFQMLGVPRRRMLTGNMTEHDWQVFNEAKALLMNSPLYVSDVPLDLEDLRHMLEREINEHGIQQVVLDYDWLINAPGKDEIQQSQNTSRMCKQLSHELNLSVVLISSVNKLGMGSASENVTKANVSGSGKKLHDADIIYIMTKFNSKKNSDLSIMPEDYDRISSLHIEKGRELDYHIPNKVINYIRQKDNPKFDEMKDMGRKDTYPSWLDRADIGD
jgi:KaiC/GvpD/RAD55 family RecA-like ATPase